MENWKYVWFSRRGCLVQSLVSPLKSRTDRNERKMSSHLSDLPQVSIKTEPLTDKSGLTAGAMTIIFENHFNLIIFSSEWIVVDNLSEANHEER